MSSHILRSSLTARLLDIVPSLRLRVRARNVRDLEHLHRSIQHPMDNLKASRLVTPYSRRMSLIPRLALPRRIFEDDLRGFEYLDRQRMRAILAYRLKKAWDEGCPYNLELERLRISNLNGRVPVVGMV